MAECGNGLREVMYKQNISAVCSLCGAFNNLMLCSRCRGAWYCCKEHQKTHWKHHKRLCKQIESSDTNLSELRVNTSSSASAAISANANNTDLPIHPSTNLPTSDGLKQDKGLDVNNVSDSGTRTCVKSQPSTQLTQSQKQHRQQVEDVGSNIKPIIGSTQTILGAEGSEALSHDPTKVADGFKNFSDPDNLNFTALNGSFPNMAPSSVGFQHSIDRNNRAMADYVVKCLNEVGICVLDNFLGEQKGLEILREVKTLHKVGEMQDGQTVSMKNNLSAHQVRGDIITWKDGSEVGCEHIGDLTSSMDTIVMNGAGRFNYYNVNGRTKAMVACYPGGGNGYVRHVDNPNEDGRCITCIYYLNRNWNSRENGGALRIYPEGRKEIASIEPKFDRLLFFWSDRRNPHEVLPAYSTRYAITVWYFDAQQRANAKLRYQMKASGKI